MYMQDVKVEYLHESISKSFHSRCERAVLNLKGGVAQAKKRSVSYGAL
jgi:hypothetical protein